MYDNLLQQKQETDTQSKQSPDGFMGMKFREGKKKQVSMLMKSQYLGLLIK